MKKKRQYLWITVVSVLFLVITGCLGGWMASMYSYARVQEAMSHVIRSTNIDRQENYQEYFESPTSELQESVVTSFLGSKLMDSYIPEVQILFRILIPFKCILVKMSALYPGHPMEVIKIWKSIILKWIIIILPIIFKKTKLKFIQMDIKKF